MFARFALANAKFVVFAVAALAALGVGAYLQTPQSIFPPMSFSRIDVVADAGELPPDRVRASVALPIEGALQALSGVRQVATTSSQGSAEFVVAFDPSVSAQNALQAVDQAIASVRDRVPDASGIVAAPFDVNGEPIVSYALTSTDLSTAVLRTLATTQLVTALRGLPGVGKVAVAGGAPTEYRVELDVAALAASGLGAADVSRAIAAANDVRGLGIARRYGRDYALLVDNGLGDRSSLEHIEVPLKSGGAVTVGSLGRVRLGTAPETSRTSIGGRPAVIVSAYAAAGADTVAAAAAVRSALDHATAHLPASVHAVPFWDQTTLVVASQTALRDAIVLGALLALAIIFAFLRDVRLTLVAAAVIPVAIAIALLGLKLAGSTLNLMSLGGLAVAVGLIIDDTIVVVEAIARARAADPSVATRTIVERTIATLGGPMAASTLATVVVFLPLALVEGVPGFFFRALALTLGTALVVSLFLALFVAPALAAAWPSRGEAHAVSQRGLLARYPALLSWALDHRGIVALASAGVLAVTVALFAITPSDFLPKMDEGEFEIAYALPVGTTLATADAAARDMERIVEADPGVAAVAGLSGIDSNGVSPTLPNRGALRVRLRPGNARDGYETIAERLRERLGDAVPSGVFDFRQILEDLINDLNGNLAPIVIAVRGDDQQTAIALAQRIASKIARVPGVVDASADVGADMPSLRIAPNAAQLAALNAASGDAGDALAASAGGTVATSLAGTSAPIPVRVTAGTTDAGAPDTASETLALGGAVAPLASVANVRTVSGTNDILSVNGRTTVQVIANSSGANLSSISAGIDGVLASIALPPGYTASVGGDIAAQSRSFADFARAIGISIALVYAVMIAAFRSFRIPLVVLAALPLAPIGVALGLTITHTAFNVSSFMGLLLLVGIVVKNGILLVDVANRRCAEGVAVRDALLEAGRTRLRPILMTTLAAIAGLVPLALGFGEGSEMERPLAIAVIGGLTTATAFTLILIPVLYAVVATRRIAPASAAAVVTACFAVLALAAPANAQQPQAQPQPQSQSAATPAPTLIFSNLSLAAAVTAAFANSPDVAAARAREDESALSLAAARGGALPSFVSSYAQVPQGNPPGPNIVSRQVSAQLQWNLSDVFGLSSTVRAAALALAAAQADRDAAEIAERKKAVGLYFDALRARALNVAARSAVDAASDARAAAQVRFDTGDGPRLDVVRADVALAKAQADAETAGAADANASDALAVETAIAADRLAATAVDDARKLPPAPIDPARAVELARANSPELRSARRTAEAARAAASAAHAATFPAATISGGYLTGTDSGVPISAPEINATLAIPLGNAGGSRAAAADAAVREAAAKALGVERTIELDVAAAARTLAASVRAALAAGRARTFAAEELRATGIGYRSGASSGLELSAARDAFAQAVAADVTATYDLQKARATFALTVGN